MTAQRDGIPEVDMYQQPGHLIRRAQQIHNQMWVAQVSTEVTSTQFAVLSVIAAHPETDQNTVAREASLDTSTTADVINRLTVRGYLHRTKDPRDMRRNLHSLSGEGQELFDRISISAARMTDRLVDCLSDDERREFVGYLQRVVEVGETARDTTVHDSGNGDLR
ncbi:MarR family winged helix-turn-helix transcriptional regulator [Nocardia sp. NPDC003963]